MKRTMLLAANIFFVVPLFAQDTTKRQPSHEKIVISVEEATEKMSQGYNPGLKVFIPDAQKKDVDRDFAKYMKEFNAKGKLNKSEYFFDNATIKQFGNNPVDVYSITTQKDKGTQLEVFFDLGGGYLNSKDDGDKFEIAQRMIHDFAKEEARNAVQNQIAIALKVQQGNMKTSDDLTRQDSLLRRKIRTCQLTIKESEEGLKQNGIKQEAKQKEIEDQQKLLDALKSKEAGIE